MSKRVPVEQAAKILGMAVCEVRYRMKTDKEFEQSLGLVLPPKKKGGYYQYLIYSDKLDKITGEQHETQDVSETGKESA